MSFVNKHPLFRSVRSALIFVVLAALIPSCIIIVLTGYNHIANLRENARENTLRQVESFAEIQNRITVFTRQTLTMLAGLPMVKRLDPEGTRTILKAVLDVNRDFLNFTVTNAGGVVVGSALLSSGANLSDRKNIRDALSSDGFAAGEYVISRALQEPSFNFAQVIHGEEGGIAGAVGAIYRLSVYKDLLDNLNLPDDSMLGITDRNGVRLFFYPEKETNPVGVSIKEEMWKILKGNGDSGTTLIAGSDGIRRIYAFKKLRLSAGEEPYMYFVLGLPETSVMAPARKVMMRNLAFLLLVLMTTLGIAWILSGVVYGNRLKEIIAATQLIHEGDFSARTNIPADDSDLGRVAGALDRMASALEQREIERRETAKNAEKSLLEKETLLREVHHRVKNNLQVILSLVRLQEGADGSSSGVSTPMEARINAMSLVHEMLYQSVGLDSVDLSEYVPRLSDLVIRSEGVSAYTALRVEAEHLHLSLDRAIPFALAFNELLSNACKHAVRGGGGKLIAVTLKREGGEGVLSLQDDGPGLPEGFDPAAMRGLGMTLVLGLTRQLGGALRWENRGGAAFSLRFPI